MKHILPLTYEPKIPDVRSGKCTQTIRPISYTKPKKKGDLVMFHGWSGKPYRSKWGWRTPYWKIIEAYDIYFSDTTDRIIIRKSIDDYKFFNLSGDELEVIAIKDGFKNFEKMTNQFRKMYGEKFLNKIFTVIQWNYSKGNLH